MIIEFSTLVILLVGLFGFIGTLVGAWLTYKAKKQETSSQVQLVIPQQIIDQYQEMVATLKGDLNQLQSRVSTLELKQDAYRTYVWVLREHISLDKGAPPPDWPHGLP